MQYSTTEGTQGICPPGWHIPALDEFQSLSTTVGGDGNALKDTTQGTGAGKGTNTSGFSALLAGHRTNIGSFSYLGSHAIFWSSTEYNTTYAHDLFLYNVTIIYLNNDGNKEDRFSVRCIKD